MSKNYQIEYLNGITKVSFNASPTYDDVKIVIDDLSENHPYEKRLWDFSNIKFDFKVYEIDDIAEYGKKKFVKPNILAIIAPDDNAYSEMRIFEVFREQENKSHARVFRNEEEAIKWLLK